MNQQEITKQFLSIYDTQADSVYRYCYIRTSQKEVSEDLTQEAFMRFWDCLSKGQDIQNHRAFLFTIVRRLIIDWYRKKKSQSLEALLEQNEYEESGLLPEGSNVHDMYEHSAEARYLIGKIKELEPSYQQAVYFRFVEGLPPTEIAEILGESTNIISVRINRGIKKLRELCGYEKEIESHEQQ
jgi:RNA polymerase sigma-70 factor, ECF subfamily